MTGNTRCMWNNYKVWFMCSSYLGLFITLYLFDVVFFFPYDIYRFLLKSLMTDASGIVLDF